MSLVNGQQPLYACLNHQQNFGHRLGGGGPSAPAWLPVGAVAGVDYTEGEAWLFDTLITDLSTIHTDQSDPENGEFDPTAITAAGMAITEANTNRPRADGALRDVFLANDFCALIEWDQLTYNSIGPGIILQPSEDGGSSNFVLVTYQGSGNLLWTDGNNGEFETIGAVTEDSRNKIASSANSGGWLTSLNGASAVLDSPITPALVNVPVYVLLGCDGAGAKAINGTIRRIIFYPNEQNAAFLEALST